MQFRLLVSLLTALALLSACAGSGNKEPYSEMVEQVYDSGLRSIVWESRNSHSRNEASVALLVKAGSLHETPDQLGFAHFVEHMGFNSTRDFPNASVVKRLQSLGVSLGAHANAYTTYDHTLYYLQLNDVTDKKLAQAVEIMAQWARYQNFEAASVAAEIPVVVEEWRLHQSKEKSANEQFADYLYHGSRYAKRRPVGTQESIKSATSANLTDYYQAWYQPANSSIIVTGDINITHTRGLIEQYFGDWKNSQPAATQVWDVNYEGLPDQMLLLDERLTEQQLELSWLVQQDWPTSAVEEMEHLAWQAGLDILNDRLDERVFDYEGRISQLSAFYQRVDKHQMIVNMTAGLGKSVYSQAVKALAQERWRMVQFGVTKNELEQWKRSKIKNEQSQQDSAAHLLNLAIQHELYDGRLEGQEDYFSAMQSALDTLEPDQVNSAFMALVKSAPKYIISQNKRQPKPDIAALKQVYAAVDFALDVGEKEQHSDNSSPTTPLWQIDAPFSDVLVDSQSLANDVTQWTFSNGLVMFHKYNDSAPGKAYVELAGMGGYNQLDTQQTVIARMAAYAMPMSGLRSLDASELERWIESNGMGLQPWFDFSSRGISVNGPVNTMETWLELGYVALTEGRFTDQAWQYALNQSKQYIDNYKQHPHYNFSDFVEEHILLNDPALRTLTVAEIESVQTQQMQDIYHSYYAGVQNYHGAIVGDVSVDEALQVVARTLAQLPKTQENLQLSTPRAYPAVQQSFTQQLEGSGEESARITRSYVVSKASMLPIASADSVAYIEDWVTAVLSQTLREELGLTYSVSASIDGFTLDYDDFELVIDLQVAPKNIDEAKAQLDKALNQLAQQQPQTTSLLEWQDIQRGDFEQYASSAQSQANLLSSFGMYPVDSPADMLEVDKAVGSPDAQEMGLALAQFMAPSAIAAEIVWLP